MEIINIIINNFIIYEIRMNPLIKITLNFIMKKIFPLFFNKFIANHLNVISAKWH